jgi:hypothetical protein
MHQTNDGSDGLIRVLMFPDPHHLPSGGLQTLASVLVTPTVGFDLLTPKVGIAFRPGRVDRTAVPETAVDEDRHANPHEGDIGAPSWLLQNHMVDPIA